MSVGRSDSESLEWEPRNLHFFFKANSSDDWHPGSPQPKYLCS